MADIELDLEKGLKEGGWKNREWRQKLHFDKDNKNQTIKLKSGCTGNKTLKAKIEIKVSK